MPIHNYMKSIIFIFIFKKKRYLSEKMLLLQHIVGFNVLEATLKY